MAVSANLADSGPYAPVWTPLPVPLEPDRAAAVIAENQRHKEWFDRHLSARTPYPIIVNGDFGSLGTSSLPVGWVLVGSPTLAAATGTGLGAGLSITSSSTNEGVEYVFNVKPKVRYCVVADVKGRCLLRVVRGTGASPTAVLDSLDYNFGTGTWHRLPSINIKGLTFESANDDETLTLQCFIGTGGGSGAEGLFAQVQVWEGAWPRPFQDLRQGIDEFNTAGNVRVGPTSLATTATDGFLYVPSCAGAPTGTPTAQGNRVAMVYDRTNNAIYFYNGSWRSVAVT